MTDTTTEVPRDPAEGGPVDGEPPVRLTGLRRIATPRSVAGLKAVKTALAHMRREGHGTFGALKTLSRVNQKGGFDCPGCAWPDPDDRRSMVAEYCENGAKAVAEETTRRRCDADYFARHSVADLAALSDFELSQVGRLTEPMALAAGDTHYRPISWDDALGRVAEHLRGLSSPDRALFYTSGRTSNEAAFLYQLLVRRFGTNNLPDCSNMCHESSGVGLAETVGIGKGSVTLGDFEEADLIVVVGQNPGTNHPRMLTALRDAKRGGAKIVSVNPLREAGLERFQHPQDLKDMVLGGTRLADLFVQVTVGGDLAFFKAALALLAQRERAVPGSVVDRAFCDEHTDGLDALLADLGTQDVAELARLSDVPLEQVEAFCDLVVERPKMIVCWAMGITQHRNGVANVREIVNLLLLRGSIGKPGAGTCPVRGHSNVQGDRTMGIHEAPKPEFLDRLGAEFGFDPPREHGHAVVHAIEAMRDGEADVFFAMGGNFLSATPDTEVTSAALRRCALTAHVSTKLNRSHLVHGREALILPCLGRSEVDAQAGGEQIVTMENSMGVVHSSRGALAPASAALRSEVSIVAGLARATLGADDGVDWEGFAGDYDRIRDSIERVIPGFERYNERVREPGGFLLPNGARERRFQTATAKARFTVNEVETVEVGPGELKLTTIRTHDQFNTTIYGLDDRYRGLLGERRVVMLHPEDLAERGLEAEQLVDIHGARDAAGRVARRFHAVPYDIPRGCAATYFPEANVLVPLGTRAKGSHTPASKLVVVTLRPAEG
ncbi:MAG: FdhF/YdeP family oxidoreductase [Planctomycetota bacterium]